MSKIRVNTNALDQQAQQMEQIAKMLGSVSSDVSYVNRNLSWKISSRAQIKHSLNNYSSYINNLERKSKSFSGVLKEASTQYQSTEKKLGAVTVKGKENSKDNGKKNTEPEKDKKDNGFWEKIWDAVAEGGVVGPLIAIFGGLATGGVPKTTKDWGGILKKIVKSAGAAGKATTSSFDLKTLLGLNVDKKAGGTFIENLQKQVDKLKWSKADKVGDKIAVGAKWAGYGLTLLTTGYDNFTDESNTTFGRKLAETIGETGVKIGEGIVLAAVAGTLGAPAVLTGALTVGATWGIDYATKYLTKTFMGEEKDFAEFVSDAVLDTVGSKVKKAGKAIGGWWKDITSPGWRTAYAGGGGGSW